MPIHPGETLSEMLGERRISQVRLAREIGVPPGLIGEIVRGHRAIAADTALRLARGLGTTAQFWLRLQEAHDLERAHDASGEGIDVVEPLVSRPACPGLRSGGSCGSIPTRTRSGGNAIQRAESGSPVLFPATGADVPRLSRIRNKRQAINRPGAPIGALRVSGHLGFPGRSNAGPLPESTPIATLHMQIVGQWVAQPE